MRRDDNERVHTLAAQSKLLLERDGDHRRAVANQQARAERIGVSGARDDLLPFLGDCDAMMPPLELDSGAERVLARLGLGDSGAEGDLDELRELLQAWRDAKASAWKAFIEWAVRALLAVLLIGIAVRLGVWELL